AARVDEREPGALAGKGGLLIADVSDWRVRRLGLKAGTITTFAGTGRRRGKIDRAAVGDGGPATAAVLVGARAVCVDGRGNTYVCEREGNAVRKVDAQGGITTVAGAGGRGDTGGGGGPRRGAVHGPQAGRRDRPPHRLPVG